MQLFYLVHFLNVCAYILVILGLVTSIIFTSPKFNTNSLYLHHEGTWTCCSCPWIFVAHPSHVRILLSHLRTLCTQSQHVWGTFFWRRVFLQPVVLHHCILRMLLVWLVPSSRSCLLPYNFWILWPLSVTFDKVGKLWMVSSYKAVKNRASLEDKEPS